MRACRRCADGVAAGGPAGQGAAVEGATLYTLYGCVNCHGPNGLGGVPNPQSEDKTIPPLTGQDFRSEFDTDAKIIARDQERQRDRQAPVVSMPHWGGIIPDDRLNALVAYLKTLKYGTRTRRSTSTTTADADEKPDDRADLPAPPTSSARRAPQTTRYVQPASAAP